ncbi:hypothetical protein SAMN04487764_2828 [Gillisia sp. Hel1_33_143]|uniref:hypothetical protein n=1 Tax=Gillisia sp. Hel1_33_143 TaxID=1336796 RepID=UPI00087B3104|nr:hypothetical protein [Gillisia sp. Hel1_33_143]SDS69761.1 hypothetical protein SAMN04487764_2828 [Gillisia sp. Hel1_33_143]
MTTYLKTFIALFFLFNNDLCTAQNRSIYIPDGYILFEEYSGDLNNDGLEDCVLVVKNTQEKNIVKNRFGDTVDRNRRGIIVLLRDSEGYNVAVQNLNCFSSENEDGGVYFPPELSLNIENGKLNIAYEHGRYGNWKYIFRYKKSNFELIGYESCENRGTIINSKTSINFLTEKKQLLENIFKNGEDKDEVFKETWKDIDIKKVIMLSEIEDFEKMEMYKY